MSDFKKYPKIKRLGDEQNAGILDSGDIILQEKLDGANFRFTWDNEDERIVFGSRNVEYWNEKDIDKNFEGAVEYVRDNIDKDRFRNYAEKFDEFTVFGEAMHPHTLDYDWENTPRVILFDMYSSKNGIKGLPPVRSLGLPEAPVLFADRADDFDLNEYTDGTGFSEVKSEYVDSLAEGFVVKNLTTGQRAKVRSEQFKEMHKGGGTSSDDDSLVLARKFATESRIKKQIHKYRDSGREINMGIMEDLWRDVFDDIIEEEYETIFLGNHTINTKDFRSEVASQTAGVLQRYLQRPQESVLNDA